MHHARPLFALLFLFFGTTSIACSGGAGKASGATQGDTDGGAYNAGWDGQTNIEAIFEASCSACHATQWSSCWNVQANSSTIEAAVSSGAMPRGAPLSASDKATLLDWLSAGATCTGPRENPNGGGSSSGGPPVPAGAAVSLDRSNTDAFLRK